LPKINVNHAGFVRRARLAFLNLILRKHRRNRLARMPFAHLALVSDAKRVTKRIDFGFRRERFPNET
jgi:hypothetical protein